MTNMLEQPCKRGHDCSFKKINNQGAVVCRRCMADANFRSRRRYHIRSILASPGLEITIHRSYKCEDCGEVFPSTIKRLCPYCSGSSMLYVS